MESECEGVCGIWDDDISLTPIEAEDCLRNIVFCVDTREQPTAAFKKRMECLYPNERETLSAGDYTAKTLLPNGVWFYVPTVIERKQSLTEICGNFCQERARFVAEFERARDEATKVIILIENATWEDAYAGSYRSKMTPQSFIASILTWLARYDCQILFCKPQTTGKLIHDILRYEMREALEKMIAY